MILYNPERYGSGFFYEILVMEEIHFSEEDRRWMRRAMELAERGKGFVNPNPLVGAVIVQDGQVIGEGWHEYYGGLHAERNALLACTVDPCGATMYVTLEPCCHFGKTPPCTEALVEKGIARVVIGLTDPNPLVGGKGMEKLKEAGMEVTVGLEVEALKEQNRIFLKYIRTKFPWVALKTAMTLDGKIAASGGDSKWVTGEEARRQVQQLRAEYKGILVGSGTVKADDPLLNCRLEGNHRQPVRIVADSKASIAFDSQIIRTARVYPTIIAHTFRAPEGALEMIQEAGADTLLCKEKEGRIDVTDLLFQLGKRGIDSVLSEGGGELNYSLIREECVDEVYAFIAPKIIGGREAKTPVEGKGFERMKEAVGLHQLKIIPVGPDVLINGKIAKDR